MTWSERRGCSFFSSHGKGQQLGVFLARLAAIRTAATVQSRAHLPLSTGATGGERCAPRCIAAVRWAADVPVGSTSGSTARAALRESLPDSTGLKQRAPEDGPVFIVTTHRVGLRKQGQDQVSESQATSAKARPCGETGEELLRERGRPTRRSDAAACAIGAGAARAADCGTCAGATAPTKRWQSRSRMLLQDQLLAPQQRRQLTTQPGQCPPEGAVIQQPAFFQRRSPRGRLVGRRAALGTDRLAIRWPVVLQVNGGQMEQRRTGVTLIREYESRGNR